MKLARVLATDRAKVSTPAAPRVEPAQARSSSDFVLNGKVCCGSCRGGGTSVSASKYAHAAGMSLLVWHCRGFFDTQAVVCREEHWSCGVCYEEVCCPVSLPCGELAFESA